MTAIKTILILLFIANKLLAGTVDLEITLESDINGEVDFRNLVEFSVTLTNNGSDDAGTNTTFPYPNSVNSSLVNLNQNGFVDVSFIQNFNINQECYFAEIVLDPPPNGEVHYVYEIGFPIVPAHSSITCYGIYHIGFESGERKVKLKARTSLGDVDTNPNNNEIEIVFGIKPQVIPFFTNIGLFLLILLFILTTFFKIYR